MAARALGWPTIRRIKDQNLPNNLQGRGLRPRGRATPREQASGLAPFTFKETAKLKSGNGKAVEQPGDSRDVADDSRNVVEYQLGHTLRRFGFKLRDDSRNVVGYQLGHDQVGS